MFSAESALSFPDRQRAQEISRAAADFFFLQNRLYPRASALEWVGNRYSLTQMERNLLHRGIFSQTDALRRLARRCGGAGWTRHPLAVDGHNVQITVESAILGRPLLKANDGALRDLAGLSARFRFTEVSELAMDMIFRFLEENRPRRVAFLFDAPMSHSGLLAAKYKERLKSMGLSGEARAVPVPEKEIPYEEYTVASSDHAVLDRAVRWLDLADMALHMADTSRFAVDFSSVLTSRFVDGYPVSDHLQV